ncbi:MAG TPA: DUF2283 domain-containing protein [Candidatus Saccharimonadales bacterium]|nr:DUF2283 domain-containing protein [Candidatus Saccharimonadales bacterium]
MEHRYDPQADAVYVRLKEGTYARGTDLDDRRRIDFDAAGDPIGVEFLGVSEGLEFDGIPDATAIQGYLEAQRLIAPRPATWIRSRAPYTSAARGMTLQLTAVPTSATSVSVLSESAAAVAVL